MGTNICFGEGIMIGMDGDGNLYPIGSITIDDDDLMNMECDRCHGRCEEEMTEEEYERELGFMTLDMIRNLIKEVIFNDPATVVIWWDGTKTVVKCNEGDTYNKEFGLLACITKKFTGNTGRWNEILKDWCKDD